MKTLSKILMPSCSRKVGKKLTILFLVIFLLTGFSALKAQILTLPENADFFDYMNSFYTSNSYKPSDTMEGGEKAQHERLSQTWGTRLYPHGDFSVANKAIIDYAQNFVTVNNRAENPNWISLGPSNNPVNSTQHGVGQIHRITFDPNYELTNQTVYACTGFGGLWRTENDGELWENVNTDGLPVTSVADVAINPNDNETIFIATGLPDGGVTLSYSPNWANTNPIYTIGIYRSTDYGNTWHPINNGFIDDFYDNGGTIRKMAIDNNNPNNLFVATSNGIYRTQNALASTPLWVKVFAGNSTDDGDFRNVQFKPGNSDIIYAASIDIFKSTDGGDNWETMTGTNTGLDFESLEPFYPFRINLAVTPAGSEKLYAYIWGDDETLPDPSNYDAKSVFIYVYDGNTWSEFINWHGYNSKGWMGFAVSPVDDEIFFAYGDFSYSPLAGVYGTHPHPSLDFIKYTDYISDGVYADGHVLAFQPNVTDNPKLFFGHDAGVSVLDVDINTLEYEFRNTGLQNMLIWSFDDSEFEKDIAITANQDCYSYFYEDNTWSTLDGGGDSYTARSSKVNQDIFFVGSSGEILRSFNKSTSPWLKYKETNHRPYDGEQSWKQSKIVKTFVLKSLPNDNADYFSFCEIYKRNFDWADGHDPNDLWEIDSDIGKIEWSLSRRQITELDFCQANPDVIYIATGGVFSENENGLHLKPYLFKTTTGGNNGNYNGVDAYNQLDYPGINNDDYPVISGIAVHPTDPDKVWLSLIGYDNISIRVAYSDNGGQTWENADPNNSLPKLPVNNIVYQYGSNDVLYIATDVGIYYKNASMENWEEYGEFPHVRVTELKINYCQGKLRAATFGRSLWEADLLPMDSPVCYAIKDGETVTWNKQKTLQTGVRIEAGGELIITGLVNMPKKGSIIVEAGGKLTIDGGTLTNGCGETWEGIQVWGTSSGAQNPLEQGLVYMNNGTIENATRAIVANNYETPDAWKQGHTGGIIQADNSMFKNNITGVQFDPYEPFSASWFNNCQFISDNDYPFEITPYAFADIRSHRGIQFANCSFSNTEVGMLNMPDRGAGIHSSNGGFSVNQSSFTGLYYGIYGLDILAQYTFYVHDATFTTYRGIYMSACQNNHLSGNTFTVPVSLPGINNNAYGLYMQNSTGYRVEDNTFTSTESIPTGIGMYINSSGTDDNEIYKNNFSNLQFSIIAQDINRNGIIGGLVIKCNTFTNTISDISVVGSNNAHDLVNHGIAKNQGANSTDPAMMAGNLFYYNGTPNDFDDLNNSLNHFNYYYPLNVMPGFENVEPRDFTENTVNKEGKNVNENWYFNIGCPPISGGGDDRGALRNLMAAADYKADSTSAVLALLVDGGNTPELTTEVDQSTPPETVVVYNELMDKSPYLSDSVVESAILKEDVLPNSMLRDIMVANAHSAKSDELMNALNSRWDPMPDYMKAQILQGRSLISLKEETESCLGAFNLNKARAYYSLTRYFMADTINPVASADSLAALLASGTTLSAYYKLALFRFNRGEYTLGSNVLSDIPINFMLNADETTEHQNMVDYYNWLIAVKQEQGNILCPDSAQQQQLWNIISADSTRAGIYARNLKVVLGETTYNEPIILPDIYKSTRAMADYEQLLNSEAPGLLKVFPNPASGYIILEYKLETNAGATILIQDMRGVTIKSLTAVRLQDQITMITRDWASGIYIASIKVNGLIMESVKFTVVD